MHPAAFLYVFVFSSLSRCNHAFAVCDAGGCLHGSEVEVLDAVIFAASNDSLVAVGDNLKRGRVRGLNRINIT